MEAAQHIKRIGSSTCSPDESLLSDENISWNGIARREKKKRKGIIQKREIWCIGTNQFRYRNELE